MADQISWSEGVFSSSVFFCSLNLGTFMFSTTAGKRTGPAKPTLSPELHVRFVRGVVMDHRVSKFVSKERSDLRGQLSCSSGTFAMDARHGRNPPWRIT